MVCFCPGSERINLCPISEFEKYNSSNTNVANDNYSRYFCQQNILLPYGKYPSLQPRFQPIFSLQEEVQKEALEHFVNGSTFTYNMRKKGPAGKKHPVFLPGNS